MSEPSQLFCDVCIKETVRRNDSIWRKNNYFPYLGIHLASRKTAVSLNWSVTTAVGMTIHVFINSSIVYRVFWRILGKILGSLLLS